MWVLLALLKIEARRCWSRLARLSADLTAVQVWLRRFDLGRQEKLEHKLQLQLSHHGSKTQTWTELKARHEIESVANLRLARSAC